MCPLGLPCFFIHFGWHRGGACSISNQINGRSTTPGATWFLGDMMKCRLCFYYAELVDVFLSWVLFQLVPVCFKKVAVNGVFSILMNGWQDCVCVFTIYIYIDRSYLYLIIKYHELLLCVWSNEFLFHDPGFCPASLRSFRLDAGWVFRDPGGNVECHRTIWMVFIGKMIDVSGVLTWINIICWFILQSCKFHCYKNDNW